MGWPQAKVYISFSDPLSPPQWVDVSPYVRSFSIRRGRQQELDRVEAGTAVVELDNRDRRFDPAYTGGPYYPNVLPMRRVRIAAVWAGVEYPLFTGFSEGWALRYPGGLDAVAVLSCVDAFKVLNLYRVSADMPQELSGARVNRVLDLVGWPADLRAVDAGQSYVQASSLQNDSALEHLQLVAESEGGLLFISSDGRVVFRERHYRIRLVSSAPVFGDAPDEWPYQDIEFEHTDTMLWNRVIVRREGSTQAAIAEDNQSQSKFFVRVLEKIGLLHTTDAESQAAAESLVYQYAQPRLVVRALRIVPADDAMWPTVLGLDLSSVLIVRRRPSVGGTIEQRSFVEGIEWDVEKGSWQLQLRLSPAYQHTFWILAGSDTDEYALFSRLGETTRLAY